jgi:hypothetical protein
VQLETTAPVQLEPGASVRVLFDAFDPGVEVEVWFWPVSLGKMIADSNGEISGNVTVPVDATPGVHTVEFRGTNGGGPRDIEVLVEIPGQPAVGDSYGVWFEGFEPGENVTVFFGPIEWVVATANQDGGVYTQIPVPLHTVEIAATGNESRVSRSKTISPSPTTNS